MKSYSGNRPTEFCFNSAVRPPSISRSLSRLACPIWQQTVLTWPSWGRRATPLTKRVIVSASRPLPAETACACHAARPEHQQTTFVRLLRKLASPSWFARPTCWVDEEWRFFPTNNNWTATCVRLTSHRINRFWWTNTSATPRRLTLTLLPMARRCWSERSWST